MSLTHTELTAQARGLPGILLAAGLSRRMGRCKLLLNLGGQPLILHALMAGMSRLTPLVVVVGPNTPLAVPAIVHKARAMASENEIAGDVVLTTAARANLGQAESLKAGLARVLEWQPDAPGVMVLLGDQPLISPALVTRLAHDFLAAADRGEPLSVAPEFEGQRGNPVVLHRDLFAALARLEGDEGARSLLASFPLRLIPCTDDACLADVDNPESYALMSKRFA